MQLWIIIQWSVGVPVNRISKFLATHLLAEQIGAQVAGLVPTAARDPLDRKTLTLQIFRLALF